MNTVSKMTSKGQLTVPYYIRNKFSFNAGDTIEFEEKEDYVIIRKPKNLTVIPGHFLTTAHLPRIHNMIKHDISCNYTVLFSCT